MILGVALIGSVLTQQQIGVFTRDPAAIINSHPFIGALSNIGILFWCATAAIAFFSAAFLRLHMVKGELLGYLLSFGSITLILMLDDLFLVHEMIFPNYFFIIEEVPFALYGLMVLLWLFRFRQRILTTDFLLLLLAFGFFGLSIGVDVLEGWLASSLTYLFEDGFKLFGIVTWFTYGLRTSLQALETVYQRETVPVAPPEKHIVIL
jgi:hypothetical protein